MIFNLKIMTWNANGLTERKLELETFLRTERIDIALISETRFTSKSHISIKNYSVYTTNHPSGKAHGGTAILIKSNIKHYPLEPSSTDKIQATQIKTYDDNEGITLSAIYCPPRHTISKEDFKNFFAKLGHRFISGGDWNAKHSFWGSRIITTRGRQLYQAVEDLNLESLSTGEPTYWPADRGKIPDLLDFFLSKNIPTNNTSVESVIDLSSDHTPVILNIDNKIILSEVVPKIYHRHTDWEEYQNIITAEANLKISLKSTVEVEQAIEGLNRLIHTAANRSTPTRKLGTVREHVYPASIRDKIHERRRLRKVWHATGYPRNKTAFNKSSQELKTLTKNMKNENLQSYLAKLTPTSDTNYSLWKATKYLKRPKTLATPVKTNTGTWARSDCEKANAYAEHLHKVFQPFPSNSQEHDEDIEKFISSATQKCPPLKFVTPKELQREIRNLQDGKCSGYDQIDATLLKHLPKKGVLLIVAIFNACLRISFFPSQWKIAQVVMILKPGKPPHEVSSYRPISLLPVIGKLLEKVILNRMREHLGEIIPKHQFGFREGHGTIEQVHRLVDVISRALENKQYCSAVFLDIGQAFDKVWHDGLLFKIKQMLPSSFFSILKSYLGNRCYEVRHNTETSCMHQIKSGVPQGCILGPVLYLIYTADLPTADNTTAATYADDTALLSVHDDPRTASVNLQTHLTLIEKWFNKWRIKANKDKSVHVTFTLRKETCPQVKLYNEEVPQEDNAKYLGIHLDRRLTWKKHIWTKRKQLDCKLRCMYWLIGRKSQLTDTSKMAIYKTILKPIWTYGIQLWGSASHSNIEILERFQSKTMRTMFKIPQHISNKYVNLDFNIRTVKQEIATYSRQYQCRLEQHRNELATRLWGIGSLQFSRLKRNSIPDLANRFADID